MILNREEYFYYVQPIESWRNIEQKLKIYVTS